MFTGIVEELGRVASLDGPRLRIDADLVTSDAGIGDSIAVNGCCLTVVAFDRDSFAVDASNETLALTTLAVGGVGRALTDAMRSVDAPERAEVPA